MDGLFKQPHTVTLTHPVQSRDTGTNAGSLNYAAPPATQDTIKCMLQVRGGTRAVLDNGAAYPIDAVLYTTNPAIRVDDLVVPTTPAELAGYKFVVVNVQPKSDVDGTVRHLTCSLTRSQAR